MFNFNYGKEGCVICGEIFEDKKMIKHRIPVYNYPLCDVCVVEFENNKAHYLDIIKEQEYNE